MAPDKCNDHESQAQFIHLSQTFKWLNLQVQVIQTSFLLSSKFQIIIRVNWNESCVCDIQMLLVEQEEDAICMADSSFTKQDEFNGP